MTQPFPATPLLDDFNRANAGPPPSSNWASPMRSAFTVNQLKVVSNKLESAANNADAYWTTAPGSDQEAYVTVGTLSSTAGFSLHARLSNPGVPTQTSYAVLYDGDTGPSVASDVSLVRHNSGGGSTTLATIPQNLASGDKLGIRVVGNAVEAWVKLGAAAWTRLLQATDATHTSGVIGIWASEVGSTFDDFSGGTVVFAPTNVAVGGRTLAPSGALEVTLIERPPPRPVYAPWPDCETVQYRNPEGEVATFLMRSGATGRMMPPVKNTMQPLPGADGSRLLGSALLERPVVIPVVFPGSIADRAELRRWARVLDPTRGEGTLTVVQGEHAGRSLPCVYEAGLDDLQEDLADFNLGHLVFRSARPYWQDAIEQAVVAEQGSSVTTWFPFLPLILGPSDAFASVVVTITGDAESWPIFTVVGPGTDVTAQNLTTGKSWTLPGTLAAGSTLVVDTRPGQKSVTKDGANAFASLAVGSKLWSLPRGANRVQLSMATTTVASSLRIAWRNSWLSA